MADGALQSFLRDYGQSETPVARSIPVRHSICCCGNDACAYLKHNQNALEGLEQDVRNAAKLGQALLVRHEAYMVDAEKERKDMTAYIQKLEGDKHQLENKNATVIEENRNLLDQLEAVSNAVSESDAHITSLQATLNSTQLELHKLSQLAAKTEKLEKQLVDYEREQASWQASLDAKEESEKDAMRRWQQAERTLTSLQDQLERIEREAREEKERHVEVVGRMERRHVVEKELTSGTARLQNATVSRTVARDGGTNVVSHFVKDILSDNASLQMGILELREMLQNSNDEVETLRRQLSEHQPAEDEPTPRPDNVGRTSLGDELSRATSQELHVHHHYHAPASNSGTLRRPKKKRYGALTPGHFTPQSSGRSTPHSSVSCGTPSSAAAILQQTAVSVPPTTATGKRWSTQSNQTYQSMLSSSVPNSPQSTTNRTSSLFECVFSDNGHDSSRPTTPDSEDSASPFFAAVKSRRASGSSFPNQSAPIAHRRGIGSSSSRSSLDSVQDMNFDQLPQPTQRPSSEDAIPEEDEASSENDSSAFAEHSTGVASLGFENTPFDLHSQAFYKPPIRRAASHESMLPTSGMAIHTLKPRPYHLMMPVGSLTSQAVVCSEYAHATKPSAISWPSDSSRSLLSGMAADQRAPSAGSQTLKKKASGWIFGRWGATPTPSASTFSTVSAKAAPKTPSRSSTSGKITDDAQKTSKKPKPRPAGINQPGPIFGFAPEVRVHHAPVMRSLDAAALQSVLDETR